MKYTDLLYPSKHKSRVNFTFNINIKYLWFCFFFFIIIIFFLYLKFFLMNVNFLSLSFGQQASLTVRLVVSNNKKVNIGVIMTSSLKLRNPVCILVSYWVFGRTYIYPSKRTYIHYFSFFFSFINDDFAKFFTYFIFSIIWMWLMVDLDAYMWLRYLCCVVLLMAIITRIIFGIKSTENFQIFRSHMHARDFCCFSIFCT